MAEKTTAFLYLLLRDHLPAGDVTRLVGEAQTHEAIVYTTELGALAYRLGDMLDDAVPEPEPEREVDDEAVPLQAIERQDDGGFNTLDGHELADGVVDWLDLFDDRIRADAAFVEAVNEAVEAGRLADDDTARLVADRVNELKGRRAKA